MLKALFTWLGFFLCTLGYLITPNNPAFAEVRRALGEETLSEGVSFRTPSFLAQVTSDDTVNTQVSDDGETSEITGGERAGDNLFHSFQDFSVDTGDTASFLNANDIANIFSRVTGGNISNIDGLISANGSANLFLINPAGIIFGENARLDVGGSFYGSTADSILFEDGEYSATDLNNPPLLTINAPIGLNLRDQPGDITVRGNGQGTRTTTDLIDTENALRVDSDKTLALVGGKINLEGATLKTAGGRIELGSLEGNQQVGLNPVNEGFSLDYAGIQNFQDLQLSKTSTVDSSGLVAGDIQIQGKNISLIEGSQIESSTIGDSPIQDSPGNIKINAVDTITIDGQDSSSLTGIFSEDSGGLNLAVANLSLANGGVINIRFNTFGQENAGKSSINIANLSLTDFSSITGFSFGQGNGRSIDINATESITLDKFGSISSVDGVELNITTPNLSLTNSSSIDAETLKQGNGGSININATESITLNDSSIASEAGSDAGSNAGKLNITTPNLSLTNDGSILVSTSEQGDGAKLNINTANLSLTDFSSITGSTFGQGDGGSIDMNATESITLDDNSSISSTVVDSDSKGNGGNIKIATGDFSINNATINASTSGIGNAGEINITADNFSLTNGGSIAASTSGFDANAQGDGGNITIDVADTFNINGTNSLETGIFASNLGDSTGNAGNIDITVSKLSVINGGQINSFTRGSGNGGNTTINAQDSIFLSGENSEGFVSGIFNNVDEAARGNGGTINITTNNLSIFDGANISVFSRGQGDAGLIDINANVLSLDDGVISARAFNDASGGNLEIDANVIAAFPNGNSDIRASAEQGQGGNITIDAESIFGIEERPLNDSTNDINASSEFALDGSVNVNTSDINPVQGATELPSNVVEPEQTTAQTCAAGRGTANNGLAIAGKGGVTPAPDAPLNSENIISSEQNPAAWAIPEPIETSQGKIQPARGIKVTKSGRIILTAYRTNNAGERIPEAQVNCGQR
jgi:filamentous hemagglutinin family protein